jgi:5-methylcytosine-specific restriction endonuclease McrA
MSSGAGRTSAQWEAIKRNQRAKRLPCWHCGQPIDHSLRWPDPRSFSADHLRPLSRYPELAHDPGNVVSSHLRCNQVKGDNEHFTAGMGVLSEEP